MIAWTLDDTIATLTLSRPDARNALPVAAWAAIATATDEIAASPARVLILRSAEPGIFSAGADIAEFGALQHDADARVRFRQAMRTGIEAIATLPIPTIAVIDGGCYGAAVALILACDLRIAGAPARFATTPAKLGIGYPAEDVDRLIARIGRGQASRMLLSAQPIDADEAARIGLVELLDRDGTAASSLAQAIAAHAPEAVALLKRTLADPADPNHAASFDAAFAGPAFARAYTEFTTSKAR